MLFTIGVHKNFVVFSGKHQRWSLFLIKLGIPEKRDPGLGTHTWDLGPIRGTWDPGPICGIHSMEPRTHRQDPESRTFTWDLGLSTCDPFWNIHTPILSICHMKDYMERNNFDLRSTFWKWLLHVLNCVWKVRHKNVTFKREKLYEKVIH